MRCSKSLQKGLGVWRCLVSTDKDSLLVNQRRTTCRPVRSVQNSKKPSIADFQSKMHCPLLLRKKKNDTTHLLFLSEITIRGGGSRWKHDISFIGVAYLSIRFFLCVFYFFLLFLWN